MKVKKDIKSFASLAFLALAPGAYFLYREYIYDV